jgi:DNA-binding response OmpR family regulator
MASRPRLLIAEDNPQGAELLEAYLEAVDADLRTVVDGEATLQAVREWHPDLILLDVMMPRVSGFEVCQRIKADPATRAIAVLMVTALDQPADIERGIDAGTDDFLTKPLNKKELLLRVNALLTSRQQPNALEQTLAYFNAVEAAEK